MTIKTDMESIAGVFTDPLVVQPGGWADTIPQWLRGKIITDRLLELIQAYREEREPTATDSEALAYLYTAGLVAPLDWDFAEIFFYLTTRVMEDADREPVPEDIRADELSEYRLQELAKLKRHIHEAKVKQRKKSKK